MSRNPHPNAGKPETLLTVGAVWVCIPCTTKSRNGWHNRFRDLVIQIDDLTTDLDRSGDDIVAEIREAIDR